MERHEVVEHLRISLSAVLNRDLPRLSEDVLVFADLELDSMRFIELLMSLEDTLGLNVDPESLDPEAFATVGSFADYIHAEVG